MFSEKINEKGFVIKDVRRVYSTFLFNVINMGL